MIETGSIVTTLFGTIAKAFKSTNKWIRGLIFLAVCAAVEK